MSPPSGLADRIQIFPGQHFAMNEEIVVENRSNCWQQERLARPAFELEEVLILSFRNSLSGNTLSEPPEDWLHS